jgi:hypothetical protein
VQRLVVEAHGGEIGDFDPAVARQYSTARLGKSGSPSPRETLFRGGARSRRCAAMRRRYRHKEARCAVHFSLVLPSQHKLIEHQQVKVGTIEHPHGYDSSTWSTYPGRSIAPTPAVITAHSCREGIDRSLWVSSGGQLSHPAA